MRKRVARREGVPSYLRDDVEKIRRILESLGGCKKEKIRSGVFY